MTHLVFLFKGSKTDNTKALVHGILHFQRMRLSSQDISESPSSRSYCSRASFILLVTLSVILQQSHVALDSSDGRTSPSPAFVLMSTE